MSPDRCTHCGRRVEKNLRVTCRRCTSALLFALRAVPHKVLAVVTVEPGVLHGSVWTVGSRGEAVRA